MVSRTCRHASLLTVSGRAPDPVPCTNSAIDDTSEDARGSRFMMFHGPLTDRPAYGLDPAPQPCQPSLLNQKGPLSFLPIERSGRYHLERLLNRSDGLIGAATREDKGR